MIPLTSNKIEEQIKNELLEIANFYKMKDDSYFLKVLKQLNFEPYTEIILGENGFEITIGGVGKEAQLLELANHMEIPYPIIEAFQRCINCFIGKMVFLKFCFGERSNPPSLYVRVIEPWETIFEFLSTFPTIVDALAELKEQTKQRKICFLLGFTMDHQQKNLVVKAYHLMERGTLGEQKPALISYRLKDTRLTNETKMYTFGVPWNNFQTNDRWKTIIDIFQPLFQERFKPLKGTSFIDGIENSTKLYIFRHDHVGDQKYKLSASNLYNMEGIRLIELQQYHDAIQSFTDAIDFYPDDFIAYYNRCIAYTLIEDYSHARLDCLKSRDLNLTGENDWYRHFLHFLHEVMQLSQSIAEKPSAELYNSRGVLFFSQSMFKKAKEDFIATIHLSPSFAQAYNNLGAIFINQGLFHEAFEQCGIAISLDDTTDLTNYQLALANLKPDIENITGNGHISC